MRSFPATGRTSYRQVSMIMKRLGCSVRGWAGPPQYPRLQRWAAQCIRLQRWVAEVLRLRRAGSPKYIRLRVGWAAEVLPPAATWR